MSQTIATIATLDSAFRSSFFSLALQVPLLLVEQLADYFPFRGGFCRNPSMVGRFLGILLQPREHRRVMARPLRIEFPGAVYHVTSRGNDKRPIFKNDRDRKSFLAFLGETAKRFGWSITAWVLMTNHFHLVLQ